jgi:hypothetical protein
MIPKKRTRGTFSSMFSAPLLRIVPTSIFLFSNVKHDDDNGEDPEQHGAKSSEWLIVM